MENTRNNRRKIKEGVVVSNKMQKTVVVKVNRTYRHPQYQKVITRAKKYYAHHEGPPLKVGEVVKIRETRPLSRLKRWLVVANVNT